MRKNYCRPVYWRLWKPCNDLLDEVMKQKNKNHNLNTQNHCLVKIKFYKRRLISVHEAELNT